MDVRIPWQPHIEEQYNKGIVALANQYNTNINVLQQNTDGSVLGTPGAQTRFNNAISSIDHAVSQVKNQANAVAEIARRIDNNGIIWQINKTKEKIDAEKKKLNEKQTIVNLRTEQAEALKTKEEGNLHSSWMGLWRPLSDEGRTTVFILSITFGILAIVIFGYLGYTYYLGRGGGGATVSNTGIPSSSFNSNSNGNVFSAFGGGAAFFKRRK